MQDLNNIEEIYQNLLPIIVEVYERYLYLDFDDKTLKKFIISNIPDILKNKPSNKSYKEYMKEELNTLFRKKLLEELKNNPFKIINKYTKFYLSETNDYLTAINYLKDLGSILRGVGFSITSSFCKDLLENNELIKSLIKVIVEAMMEDEKIIDKVGDNFFISLLTSEYESLTDKAYFDEIERENDSLDFGKISSREFASDSLKLYLNDIGKIPLLTKEEEFKYAKLSQEGNKEAFDKMINSNLRLVVSIARKYLGRGLPFMDLIEDGNEGLIKAVLKFDPDKGYRFSTYATWWIRQSISRAIADCSRTIRIPVHQLENLSKYNLAKRDLFEKIGHEPTIKELATHLGKTIEEIEYIENIIQDPISLNTKVGEDEDTELSELIPNGETYENDLIDFNFENIINNFGLNEKEKDILRMRIQKQMSLESVGKIYNITRERVRQIEFRAIKKIRDKRSKALLLALYTSDPYRAAKSIGVSKSEFSYFLDNLGTSAKNIINQKVDYPKTSEKITLNITLTRKFYDKLLEKVNNSNSLFITFLKDANLTLDEIVLLILNKALKLPTPIFLDMYQEKVDLNYFSKYLDYIMSKLKKSKYADLIRIYLKSSRKILEEINFQEIEPDYNYQKRYNFKVTLDFTNASKLKIEDTLYYQLTHFNRKVVASLYELIANIYEVAKKSLFMATLINIGITPKDIILTIMKYILKIEIDYNLEIQIYREDTQNSHLEKIQKSINESIYKKELEDYFNNPIEVAKELGILSLYNESLKERGKILNERPKNNLEQEMELGLEESEDMMMYKNDQRFDVVSEIIKKPKTLVNYVIRNMLSSDDKLVILTICGITKDTLIDKNYFQQVNYFNEVLIPRISTKVRELEEQLKERNIGNNPVLNPDTIFQELNQELLNNLKNSNFLMLLNNCTSEEIDIFLRVMQISGKYTIEDVAKMKNKTSLEIIEIVRSVLLNHPAMFNYLTNLIDFLTSNPDYEITKEKDKSYSKKKKID